MSKIIDWIKKILSGKRPQKPIPVPIEVYPK
jgi:hypothetical protein